MSRLKGAHLIAPELRELAADSLVAAGIEATVAHRAVSLTCFVASFELSKRHSLWHLPFLVGAQKRKVGGITLGSCVYLAKPAYLRNWPLLVHECAHVAQVLERGTPLFLLRYGAEYLWRRAGGEDDKHAYLQLSDEVQARKAEEHARQQKVGDRKLVVIVD